MGHSVSKAAENAVNKSNKQKLADRTPEETIAGIRNNLNSRLAVTGDDTRFLLAQYDIEVLRNSIINDKESGNVG